MLLEVTSLLSVKIGVLKQKFDCFCVHYNLILKWQQQSKQKVTPYNQHNISKSDNSRVKLLEPLVLLIHRTRLLAMKSQLGNKEPWVVIQQKRSHSKTFQTFLKWLELIRKLQQIKISSEFLLQCLLCQERLREFWLTSVKPRSQPQQLQDFLRSPCSPLVTSRVNHQILTPVLSVILKASKFHFLVRKCKGSMENWNWKNISTEMLGLEPTLNRLAR